MKKLILGAVAICFLLAGSVFAKGLDKDLDVVEYDGQIKDYVVPGTPLPDVTTDYCELSITQPHYTFLGAFSGATDAFCLFQDPEWCHPDPYPYQVEGVNFTMLNNQADPQNVTVRFDVHVADLGDPTCPYPGALVCSSVEYVIAFDGYGAYSISAPMTELCCVNAPYYLAIVMPYAQQNIYVGIEDYTTPPPRIGCYTWHTNDYVTWWEFNDYGFDADLDENWYTMGHTHGQNECPEEDVCENHKMHYPQNPDPNGWDVNCTGNVSLPNATMLADDFQCSQTGYIEDIHFWGSWKDDIEGQVVMFHLAIHENIDPGPHGYSEPGAELWFAEVFEPDFTVTPVTPPGNQGWYDPIAGEILPNNHQFYYRYDVLLPEGSGYWQEENEIYWLRIVAFVDDWQGTAWGWKTSIDPQFMDDAVYDSYIDPIGWRELYEPNGGGGPVVNPFWVAFDPMGQIIPDMSGGVDYYDDPSGINGWFYYPYSEWWNIWFYNAPFDPERFKEISIMGWVQKLEPSMPAWIEIAIDWSGPNWPPGQPPPIGQGDDPFIERFPFFMSDLEMGGEPFEFWGFMIEQYNPEWVSVDVRGFNFMIPEMEPGIIEHECLPSGGPGQSLDLAFCITGEGGAEPGACCYPDDRMCENLLEAECDAQGGIFLGPGTMCQGDGDGDGIDDACESVLGACCWNDGSCTLETQANCEDNGGIFYPGQSCDEVDCPVEEPVYDLWETPEGYNTYVDFGCGPSTPALPADFFGPGSDPFDGIIALRGEPLPTSHPDDLGPTDTIVRRARAASFPECPSSDGPIETEIVALNLVSVEPITVTYDGGSPEEWDVRVCLSETAPQPSGVTNFNQVCQEGGTFTANLPVIPKLIFTPVSGGEDVYFDFGDAGQSIEYDIDDGHWQFIDSFFDVYVSPEGVLVSNCDDELDILIGPSAVDLIPGLQADPCENCYDPPMDHLIPITSLFDATGLACAQQDVWPPHDVVEPIPTLTEWGMIILGLLLLGAGTIAVVRRRKAAMARTN